MLTNRWLWAATGFVALAAATWALWGRLPSVTDIAASVGSAQPGWLLIAVIAEVVAVTAFSRVQWRLVEDLGGSMTREASLRLTLSSGAVSMALPAGTAVGAGYTFTKLRKTGLSGANAGLAMTLSAALLSGALLALYAVVAGPTLLATVGRLITAQPVWTLAALLVMVITAVEIGILLRHWTGNGRLLTALGRQLRQLVVAARAVPWRSWRFNLTWALIRWAADFLVLIASALAVCAQINLVTAAAVYVGLQAVRQIPLTPGGVGVIEAALLAGLIAAGAAAAPAAAAVLIYRLLTFWLILPVGGVLVLSDARRSPNVAARDGDPVRFA